MYIDKKAQPETGNNAEDDSDDEEKKTIFCANLSEKITEEILYELFIQGGPVESVCIPKDKDGRQKTFGFVTYVHTCSVPYALELFDGVKLFNQRLVLKPKQSNNNSAKSFAHSHTPRFHIENDTRNRGDGKNFSDSSALRLGGSRALNQKNNANLQPKEPEPNKERNKNNPFNLEVLSRLGAGFADFLVNNLNSNSGNKNRSNNSRNNDQSNISKHSTRNKKPHNQNDPYKRPDSSKSGDRNRGHGNRDRSVSHRRR